MIRSDKNWTLNFQSAAETIQRKQQSRADKQLNMQIPPKQEKAEGSSICLDMFYHGTMFKILSDSLIAQIRSVWIFHCRFCYPDCLTVFILSLGLQCPPGSSFWVLLRWQGYFKTFFQQSHSLPATSSPGASRAVRQGRDSLIKLNLQAPQPSSDGATVWQTCSHLQLDRGEKICCFFQWRNDFFPSLQEGGTLWNGFAGGRNLAAKHELLWVTQSSACSSAGSGICAPEKVAAFVWNYQKLQDVDRRFPGDRAVKVFRCLMMLKGAV